MLDYEYSYLGGNAIVRDAKGRVKKDDQTTQAEMAGAGHGDADYTAYVYYELDVN